MAKLFILFLIFPLLIAAQNIRPVCDEVGFSWNPDHMDKLIKYLEQNNNAPSLNNLAAGISPHDDFLYAGRVYFPLYKNVHAKEVIIFGVTHGTVRKQIGDPQGIIILDGYDQWKAPYSLVNISPLREVIKSGLDKKYFIVDNKAHELEHSIEAELPWLQYYNRDIKITPVMVTAMPYETMTEISSKLSEIISEYIKRNNLIIGKDIFFLISSDANHYGKDFSNTPYGEDEAAHTKAVTNDMLIADKCLNGELSEGNIQMLTEELFPDSTKRIPVWCGRFSIPFGLLTTDKVLKGFNKTLSGSILKYSDTWTEKVLPVYGTTMGTTAPFSLKHWCGFISVGYKTNE